MGDREAKEERGGLGEGATVNGLRLGGCRRKVKGGDRAEEHQEVVGKGGGRGRRASPRENL